MTISTYSVIEAIDAASLTTAVTAAIAGGKQPVGGVSIVRNVHASQAFNGTIVVSFMALAA